MLSVLNCGWISGANFVLEEGLVLRPFLSASLTVPSSSPKISEIGLLKRFM